MGESGTGGSCVLRTLCKCQAFAMYTICCLCPWLSGTSVSSALSQLQKLRLMDFRGGSVVGKPPANAGDTDLIPDPERVHMLEGRQSPSATTTEPAMKGSTPLTATRESPVQQ